MTPRSDSDQIKKPREWNLASLGRSILQPSEQKEKGDRSRTPLRKGKGESGVKGFGKGAKSGKGKAPEHEEDERLTKRVYSGPATLPTEWREKNPVEVVVSA